MWHGSSTDAAAGITFTLRVFVCSLVSELFRNRLEAILFNLIF